jgi:hypothetical protein
MIEGMKTITFNMPEPLHDRLALFVENEHQRFDGKYSRELIMDCLLYKAVSVMAKNTDSFPPEPSEDLPH